MTWQTQIALALILPAIMLFIGSAVSPSLAHDHNRPELNGWFMGLQSKGHMPCCDGSDATSLEDPDWDSKDGHYRVRLGGVWVDVPDEAVVDVPNRDGRAMVWPYYVNGELRGVRCFMPGAGT